MWFLLSLSSVTVVVHPPLAEPGFSSTNWLLLGKVHQAMGHKEEARKWLKQAAEQEPRDSDEKEVWLLVPQLPSARR